MPTESAAQAASILRDPSQFEWYVIPLLLVVIYVYNAEIAKRNWNVVFAGLALWGMDWFNEIWNALVFHFTDFAPVWAAPGDTAYLILIGLNIEICFMFAIMGVATALSLPRDKHMKILGIPNRAVFAVGYSIAAVLVEYGLNSADALTWDWPWWNRGAPWLIFLIGYLPFFVVAFWVHDMTSVRSRARTVGAIYAFDAACLVAFGPVLGWI
jgi:hypothetical protein